MEKKPVAPAAKPGVRPYVYTSGALLLIFGICLFFLKGCYDAQWDQLKGENDRLTAEIQALKEQAQLAEQRCEALLAQRACEPAPQPPKRVARAVLPKPKWRPKPRTAVVASRRAESAPPVMAAAQKKEAPPPPEDDDYCGGDSVDYETFSAGVHVSLPVGKRYCFKACISMTPCLGGNHQFNGTVICSIKLDFDDPAEEEGWIKTKKVYCGQIVASANDRGGVSIHRLH